MHLLERLAKAGIAHPPKWLVSNVGYLTVMGSMAYGCNDDDSDLDVYGFGLPPKEDVFPHLRGEIPGFGQKRNRFEQYQEHHLVDPSARGGKGQEYDLTIHSIVKFFQLAMENNPNMLDALFTSRECVVHSTMMAEMLRDRRRIFLHKGCFWKFRGYANSQIAKMKSKTPEPGSRRAESIAKHGYDVKYAVHLVRLILECEQALIEGDIDLRRHSELLRTIRNGGWTEEQVIRWFAEKEVALEGLYHSTNALPYKPEEDVIKSLLLNCMEQHYGSLDKAIVIESKLVQGIRDIKDIIDRMPV